MGEGEEDIGEAIDRLVLASLRELQVDGDPDIIAEVGGLFIKHSPQKISAILQAAENGDAKGLQMAAHGLKSSSGYVGALRLSAMAKKLEEMGRSSIMQGARDLAQMLVAEHQRVMIVLAEEIKRGE
jgi:HPt (histidine-containing phosphotransfer) domain-containing protein